MVNEHPYTFLLTDNFNWVYFFLFAIQSHCVIIFMSPILCVVYMICYIERDVFFLIIILDLY